MSHTQTILEKIKPYKKKTGIFTTATRTFKYDGEHFHLFMEWRKSDVLVVLSKMVPKRVCYDGPLDKMPEYLSQVLVHAGLAKR